MVAPLLDYLVNDGEAGLVGVNRPERVSTELHRIFYKLNAIVVMVSLLVVLVLQYFLINGYITLLLVFVLPGALEVPGNALRSVESDSFKVKFCFCFCGSLSLYLIIYFGIYFNRSCVQWQRMILPPLTDYN